MAIKGDKAKLTKLLDTMVKLGNGQEEEEEEEDFGCAHSSTGLA